MQYYSFSENVCSGKFPVGHLSLSVTSRNPLCSVYLQECFALFFWYWTFQFSKFCFKFCSYPFWKLMPSETFRSFLYLCPDHFLRFSRSWFGPSITIIWVNDQSANSQRFVLCRFLAEPAFTSVRPHFDYECQKETLHALQ
jgi:hypothetical protein